MAREHLLSLCESPIERMFLEAWLDEIEYGKPQYASQIWINMAPEEFVSKIPHVTPRGPLLCSRLDYVAVQQRVESYRLDCVIGIVAQTLDIPFREDGAEDFEKAAFVLVRLPLIAVECDGHDYHERTKEQAKRDRSRDRRLSMLGFRVARFTGSEIYRNPSRCAEEVTGLVGSMLTEWESARREHWQRAAGIAV
jgi:hypothetical protein